MQPRKLILAACAVVTIALAIPAAQRMRFRLPQVTDDSLGMAAETELQKTQAQAIHALERPTPLREPVDREPTAAVSPTVPGNQIKITVVAMKAIDGNDGGANGPEDEPYAHVFRGLGINERHSSSVNFPSIGPGATNTLSQVVYDGPRILANIPYVAVDFWEHDDFPSTDDHLGGPVWVHYEQEHVSFRPTPEATETSGPYAGAARYQIYGEGNHYVIWIRADLH